MPCGVSVFSRSSNCDDQGVSTWWTRVDLLMLRSRRQPPTSSGKRHVAEFDASPGDAKGDLDTVSQGTSAAPVPANPAVRPVGQLRKAFSAPVKSLSCSDPSSHPKSSPRPKIVLDARRSRDPLLGHRGAGDRRSPRFNVREGHLEFCVRLVTLEGSPRRQLLVRPRQLQGQRGGDVDDAPAPTSGTLGPLVRRANFATVRRDDLELTRTPPGAGGPLAVNSSAMGGPSVAVGTGGRNENHPPRK